MTVIIREPTLANQIRAERERMDASRHDEVWDGVYIVSPIANNEHQLLITDLMLAFQNVIDRASGDRMFAGVNVSDRQAGWKKNYRVPDLAIVLCPNPVKDCGTHLCGGPDLVVEVISPNDLAREKRPFYAKIDVRELWIIDRDPWALEIFRLDQGELTLAGRSTIESPEALTSTVLPLSVRLSPGPDRPRIEICRTDGAQSWII